jgi:glycosyltransferase involved in cell wall biosynthesis
VKVLFITSELFPWVRGGPQNVVRNLANHLAGKVEIEVLCIAPGDAPSLAEYYHEDIEFTFVRDRGPGALKYLYRNLAFARKAGEVSEPDLVHFHILPGANCYRLPPRLKNQGRPLVLTIYDWVPDELRFYGMMEKMRHITHWQAARRGLRYFDDFVVNSTYMDEVVRSNGLCEVEIIPNGINPGEWRAATPLRLKGELNVLFWGRLYDKKGVGELIRAFAECVEGRSGIHLYIAGEGPQEERYRRLAGELGVQSMVSFTGALADDVLKGYLASSDLCVFPSAYEGFGITILEAMAAGKPVITSSRGGQTDFASDGYNALIARLDKPGDLARAIREMLDDAELRRRLGEKAMKTAEEYSWQRIASEYADFYQRVIGGA